MQEYSIQGGDEGSKRLDILNRTIEKSTRDFFKAVGINKAMNCLDIGCGTGKVSIMLAKIVGDRGQVLGLDINELNIQLASDSAKHEHIKNVNFQTFDVYKLHDKLKYDLIYSRFLLSHLKNPKIVLENALKSLKSGGKLLIEDTDFSGHFSYPRSDYFDQYVSLYQDLLKKRGANANLGLSLVKLLRDIGFTEIKFQISQPAHINQEGKQMAEITFQGISKALIEEKLITKDEFARIHSELIKFRKRKDTIISLPRIFQIAAYIP
ncbi:MAG: methyltransferase domain-containing protein [Balneolaceae bacterium]